MRRVRIGSVLWAASGLLLVLWMLGMATGFAGHFIHLLLVTAGMLLVVNLFVGRLRT